METQTTPETLRRAGRIRRLCRLVRGAALISGVLAAAACLGEFTALWGLAARTARLEAFCFSTPEPAACAPASPDAVPKEPAKAAGPTPTASPAFLPGGEYQVHYPALYATPLPPAVPAEKTVFLTFDDGPSENTAAILDTLAQYHAYGTWFIVGTQLPGREDLLRRIEAEGHTIALHSDTHEYAGIYASPEAFFMDLDSLAQKITAITGQMPGLVRFAGGSVNSYDADLFPQLTAEVLRRGLRYYDWNVSAQDAVRHSPAPAVIAQRVIRGTEALGPATPAIVLMHDTRQTTPAALPQILETLTAEGYTFAPLDSSVPMAAFSGGT